MIALGLAIREEARRIDERWNILESDKLSELDKEDFNALLRMFPPGEDKHQGNLITPIAKSLIINSLRTLTSTLKKHCGLETILLVDEYDVPLDRADQAGYYAETVGIIRNMFSLSMKTNDSLAFAVLTGCLRVSRESIFTGLNNPEVHSITDTEFSSAFGFTDAETEGLLSYYGLESRMPDAKIWYDGYQFESSRMYNPWDILNLQKKPYTSRASGHSPTG